MHASQQRIERLCSVGQAELDVALDALGISGMELSLPATERGAGGIAAYDACLDAFAPPPRRARLARGREVCVGDLDVVRGILRGCGVGRGVQNKRRVDVGAVGGMEEMVSLAEMCADEGRSGDKEGENGAMDFGTEFRNGAEERMLRRGGLDRRRGGMGRKDVRADEPSEEDESFETPLNSREGRERPNGNAFRTARSKLVADLHAKGKRPRPSDGSGKCRTDGGARAMSRAVLGPPKKPRFSIPRPVGSAPRNGGAGGAGDGGKSADGVTRDDLPEVPNIEPKLVEMIMNEMLDKSPGVDWEDIAGLHFAKRCVMEAIVWPMQRPDIFNGLRGPPKGLLLFGPPGTGKTLIGRAIASKSGAKFFNISASSLMSKWVGEGEKMVRALFAVARVFQPSVVFIDEIDSLLTQRTDGDQESSRRIKTEFLVQMDGAGTSREDRVLVVGATNRPQELDEAARRRLVKRLYIPLPDTEARSSLVSRLMQRQGNDLTAADITSVATLTKGYSGSDMYALCAEASLGPVRDLGESIGNIDANSVRPVSHKDFVTATRMVRASVSDADLDGYTDWNNMYGSFAALETKAPEAGK